MTLTRKVNQLNRWREAYNPLRGLTIARAVTLLESFMRGDFADLQWTYFFVEQTDPDLFALVERRTSSICELDWHTKTVSDQKTGYDESLAEEQRLALREAYDRIDNLYEAIDHFETGAFRGFAHVEKHVNAAGDVVHLEILDQWNVVRDGLRGQWKYNPDARQANYAGLPAEAVLDPANWIIHEPKRHINRIALIKFIRSNLSEKDWDGFIEIYGIPGWVIIMPPNVPPDKVAEYESTAKAVAEGGSGALPAGSDAKAADGPRGSSPFQPRLQFLREQLVLVGTGGLLTMLAQSGSGTLAGGAHSDTFKTIARGRARKISEDFQRQFDKAILEEQFPGKPVLAYFELAANEEQDISEIVDHAQKLNSAGYQIAPEELSEKTGYQITLKPANTAGTDSQFDRPPNTSELHAIANRRLRIAHRRAALSGDHATVKLIDNTREMLGRALANDLQPLGTRLAEVEAMTDPGEKRQALLSLLADLRNPNSELRKDVGRSSQSAAVIEQAVAAGLFNGIATGKPRVINRALRNSNPNRVPAGNSEGGQFAPGDDGGSGSGSGDGAAKDNLGKLFDESTAGGSNEAKIVAYRKVEAADADRIKQATGLDVSGYEHALDNYAVRHIVKQHGSEATELPRGQVPVTREDFAKLPDVVGNPDSIEYGGKTKQGRESILYKKKFKGTTIVVEEVRTKNKQLVPVSMRKMKNRATSNAAFTAPSHTSETLRADEILNPEAQ